MKTLIFALALLCKPETQAPGDCSKDKPNSFQASVIAPEPCTTPFDCYNKAVAVVTASPGIKGSPGSWWLFTTLRADRD